MQAILAFKQAEFLDSTDVTVPFQTGVIYMKLNLFSNAFLKFEIAPISVTLAAISIKLSLA